MRAVVAREPGGPEVLTLAERPDPVPGAGQVLVDITATGVNYVETYQRSGAYEREFPFVPGAEAAGTVAALGEGVTGLAVGDQVASVDFDGAYADRALVAADRVVPVPAGIDTELAGAVLLQGMTAHYLTRESYPVRPGDTVLLHAAAGGMGLLMTQLVKLLGGRVIGTVSTAEKEELARAAGADEVIRYTEVDFAAEVRRLTGGEGVHAVYDSVGRTTFDGSLACLRRRGTLVLYGQASGAVTGFAPQRLIAGSLWLTRPTLAHFVATRAELLARAGDVLDLVATGRLEVRVGGRYALPEARRAHEDLQGRRTTGKLLLVPG